MIVHSFSAGSQRVPVLKQIRFSNVHVQPDHIVYWFVAQFRRGVCGTLKLNPSMNKFMRRTTSPSVEREEVSWTELNPDVLQLVFSKLPEASVLRAGSVCKKWHSVTQEPTFVRYYRHSYCSCKRSVFSFGGNTKYSFAADRACGSHDHHAGDFSFQPLEDCHPIPVDACPDGHEIPSFQSAGGLYHAVTAAGSRGKGKSVVRYKNCLLDKEWKVTPCILYPVQDAIIGGLRSFNNTESGKSFNKLILVSGLPLESLGEDDDDLSFSIYDEQTDSWTTCEPPPSEFRGCCASDFRASVVHGGRFYAFDMHSGFTSILDLESKRWSVVKSLRPCAEPSRLFLVSRPEGLFVVGVQDFSIRDLRFNVWNIIDESEERIRIGKLVHSSIIPNTRPPPASAITRWKSWSLDAFSSMVALTVLMIIKLILLFHAWKSGATFYLNGLLNSAKGAGRLTSQLPLEDRSALLLYSVNMGRRR